MRMTQRQRDASNDPMPRDMPLHSQHPDNEDTGLVRSQGYGSRPLGPERGPMVGDGN